MSKNLVLITSLVHLIIAGIYGFANLSTNIKRIVLIVALIWSLVVVVAVFADAKQRGKSAAFAGLGLFLGGLGGLIYYSMIYGENESEINNQSVSQGMSDTAKRNLRIFSIILAILFGIAFVMTLPFSKNSSLSLPRTITFGIILLASIFMIFYSKK